MLNSKRTRRQSAPCPSAARYEGFDGWLVERLGNEKGFPRINQIGQPGRGIAPAFAQRRDSRFAGGAQRRFGREHVTPPSEAQLANHDLAAASNNLCKPVVEQE